MDFVSNQLADGRAFRIFTVVDYFTRECIRLEADRSMNLLPANVSHSAIIGLARLVAAGFPSTATLEVDCRLQGPH
jgi:hypothetical protein